MVLYAGLRMSNCHAIVFPEQKLKVLEIILQGDPGDGEKRRVVCHCFPSGA